tara:strand:+ start:37489 stop:38319 length:831 start_codon:yes stop_codon:yes gene_type:complete
VANMSSEKEIVNFWYNKKGYFTINNIKTTNNRDAGLLALRFENDNVEEFNHIGVSCSITNNINETTDLKKSISNVIKNKFEDTGIQEAINQNIKQFNVNKAKLRRIIVIGAVPKSRKKEIVDEFNNKLVEVIEIENILFNVMNDLDTKYYQNDIVRSLQLVKFFLLSQPEKLGEIIASSLSQTSRKELISNMLEKKEVIKEFRMTNKDRLGDIIKSSKIKPNDLVDILDKTVLTSRSRKGFVENVVKNEKMKSILDDAMENGFKEERKEIPLNEFF